MKRIILFITLASITFIIGLVTTKASRKALSQPHVAKLAVSSPLAPQTFSQFTPVSSLIEPDYLFYWCRTPDSTEVDAIIFVDFKSAEQTRALFEANADNKFAKIIELGHKFDERGENVGRRVVAASLIENGQAVNIFWTEGDIFWAVSAPSLELARKLEHSELVRAITMSNKSLKPTAR